MGTGIVFRALLLVAGLSMVSCSYSEQKQGMNSISPPAELVAKSSFADVYSRVLLPKCVGCHGRQGGVNLESHASARSFLQKIKESALIQRRMPPSPVPPLSEAELMDLAAWVEAGGPDQPLNGRPGHSAPPRLEPTYDSIRANILVPKCISCHRPGEDAKNIPLLTREDLLNSPHEIVLPGNPGESGIVLVTQPDARKKMPPIDSGISGLTREEIQTIEEWIRNGATN